MDKTGRLLKIAAITGVVCTSGGMYFQSRIRQNLKNGDYYKQSLKLLRAHKPSIEILGEPIKEGSIDLGDSENVVGGQSAQLKVPVKGPKAKGKLYIFADKETTTNSWKIQRLELAVDKIADRRLVVHRTVNT